MIIFPAIDLKNGEAVRLTQGDYNQVEVFFRQPEEASSFFQKNNATHLHIVDLDGASEGRSMNASVIERLVHNSNLFIQVGGGIRTEERINYYLDLGVKRVILGTVAVENPEFLSNMLKKYQEKIAVSVDARDGKIAVKGWKEITTIDSLEYCKQLSDRGLKTLIYTDISKDGKLEGTNMEVYKRLAATVKCDVIASGGVTFEHELKALSELGIYGSIVGKAIYAGQLDLKKIIENYSK